MYFALLGGTIGAMLGLLAGYAFAGFVGGALTAAALRAGWAILRSDDRPDEFNSGFQRTGEEVRDDLTRIKGGWK